MKYCLGVILWTVLSSANYGAALSVREAGQILGLADMPSSVTLRERYIEIMRVEFPRTVTEVADTFRLQQVTEAYHFMRAAVAVRERADEYRARASRILSEREAR